MVSEPKLCDLRADFSNDPGDLVPQHRRRRNDIVSSEQQIGMTESGRLHVDQDFASHRRGNVDVFHIEATPDRIEDKGLHLKHPFGRTH